MSSFETGHSSVPTAVNSPPALFLSPSHHSACSTASASPSSPREVRSEGFEDVHGHVPWKHHEQLHCVSSVPLHPNASHVSRSHTVAHQKLQGRRQPDDTHAGALKVIVIVGVVGVVGFNRPCSACRPFGTVGISMLGRRACMPREPNPSTQQQKAGRQAGR